MNEHKTGRGIRNILKGAMAHKVPRESEYFALATKVLGLEINMHTFIMKLLDIGTTLKKLE